MTKTKTKEDKKKTENEKKPNIIHSPRLTVGEGVWLAKACANPGKKVLNRGEVVV